MGRSVRLTKLRQMGSRVTLAAVALLTAVSSGFFISRPVAAATQTYYAGDDGYVMSGNPLHSSQGHQFQSVLDGSGTCTSPAQYCLDSEERNMYMKFAINDIPYGSTINSVTVKFYVTSNTSPDSGRVYRAYTTNWEEENLTWAGQPGFNQSEALGDIGDTTSTPDEWVPVSLPASTIKGNGIYSFAVSSDSQDEAWFGSNASWYMPQLAVDYTAPSVASLAPIEIDPTDDVQTIINTSPGSSTFLFKAGLYRLVGLDLRSNDTYLAEPGAVLNGSVHRLTNEWTQEGDWPNYRWRAEGVPTPNGASSGECDFLERCNYVEELFYNNQRMKQVDSLAEVDDEHWFYDYTNNDVVIGREPDWPAASVIEISWYQFALWGVNESNVTIKNFEVVKYASPSQDGPVKINNDFVVDNVTSMFNHGNGFNIVGNDSTVQNSFAIKNGKSGIGAGGQGNTFDNVEVGHNNTAGFSWGWDAGGSKFAFTTDLTVKNSHIHDNYGPGLWTDIDNYGTIYENNVVERNAGSGIFHEISYDAIIRDNIVAGNGYGFTDWVYGAGIQIANSVDVEVYGNTLIENEKAIMGSCQNRAHWDFDNFDVHDNIVIDSGQTGVAQDFDCSVAYPGATKSVTFDHNEYYGDVHWGWDSALRNWQQWQGYGNDLNGSYTP